MHEKILWFFDSYFEVYKFLIDCVVYIGFGFFSCQWVIQKQKIKAINNFMENGFREKIKEQVKKEVRASMFQQMFSTFMDYIKQESNKNSPPSE